MTSVIIFIVDDFSNNLLLSQKEGEIDFIYLPLTISIYNLKYIYIVIIIFYINRSTIISMLKDLRAHTRAHGCTCPRT